MAFEAKMATALVLFCLVLGAGVHGQSCAVNPVLGITESNEGLCQEGSLNVRGDLRADFDAVFGTDTSNTVLMNAAVIQNTSHVVITITSGVYNMTAAELFEGFSYIGASAWGDTLALPTSADIRAYLIAHGITPAAGMFLPPIYVGLIASSSGDLTIATQDVTPIDHFGASTCPTPDDDSNYDHTVCIITYALSFPGANDGAYIVEPVEGRVAVENSRHSKVLGGSRGTITNSKRSVLMGGGGSGVGNNVTNADNSAIVGGYSNTIDGVNQAVIVGGKGLTATGEGMTTSSAYINGLLYSDDVTVTSGDLTLDNQDVTGNGSVIVKMGHTWDSYPETHTGQFEVRDKNDNVAFAVNNWGTTVFHQGTMAFGGFLDALYLNGTIPLTADRLALGYTIFRKGMGECCFTSQMPPAVEFEQLIGTPIPPGVRFPPIYIINDSTSYPIYFALNTGTYVAWSPSPPFTNCPKSSVCKLEMVTVSWSPGAVNFVMIVQITGFP